MSIGATIVTINNSKRLTDALNPPTYLYCDTNKYISFYLVSYNNGTLKIQPKTNTTIEKFASMVAGLFEPDSNFYGVQRVDFEFDGISISVSDRCSASFLIVKQYYDKLKELAKNSNN